MASVFDYVLKHRIRHINLRLGARASRPRLRREATHLLQL